MRTNARDADLVDAVDARRQLDRIGRQAAQLAADLTDDPGLRHAIAAAALLALHWTDPDTPADDEANREVWRAATRHALDWFAQPARIDR